MRKYAVVVLAALLFWAGCSRGGDAGKLSAVPTAGKSRSTTEKHCLVLSVGGPAGVAHLGAIEALRDAGVRIDCVAGTSMGSVVGALYASAPEQNTTERYAELANAYVKNTKAEGGSQVATGFFLGAVGGMLLAPLTGGASLGLAPVTLAASAGSFSRVSHERFVSTLDGVLGGIDIRKARLPILTYYLHVDRSDISIVPQMSGNLAQAVGRSIANPLMFEELQPMQTGVLDPGLDRVSSTPIDDTCNEVSKANDFFRWHFTLIAINVTGRPAYYRDQRCRVAEVQVSVPDLPLEAIYLFGPKFEQALAVGYRETCAALDRAGLGQCLHRQRLAEATGAQPYVIEIIDAQIPPTKPDGRPWDAGTNGSEIPDASVELQIVGMSEGQFRTSTVSNTFSPRWDEVTTLRISKGDHMKIHVADEDFLAPDLIGDAELDFMGPNLYDVDLGNAGAKLRMRISRASE